MTSAVVVEDLVVRHGPVTAVDGLSFEARHGEVLAVLGPNGAGKTSTVETLEGYRRPTSGTVAVLGFDPARDHRRLVGRMGVMLQEGGIANGLRVEEAVRLYAAYYPEPLDADRLVEEVGLGDRRRASYRSLSGGEQQRLSLALALVGRPDVVFLDEPTAGVDPLGRQVIRSIISRLREDGVCVVLTTHDLDEVERSADRVLIVDAGRLLAEGTPATLRHGGEPAVRFVSSPGLDVDAMARACGVAAAAVSAGVDGSYRLSGATDAAVVAALTTWLADEGHPLDDLRVGGDRLEDVFLRLLAEKDDAAGADHTADEPPSGGTRRRGRAGRRATPGRRATGGHRGDRGDDAR